MEQALKPPRRQYFKSYYQRHKFDDDYQERNRVRARAYHNRMKDDPEYKKKNIIRSAKWKEKYKDILKAA